MSLVYEINYMEAHQSPEGWENTHHFSRQANVGLMLKRVPAVSGVNPVGEPSYQEVHVA